MYHYYSDEDWYIDLASCFVDALGWTEGGQKWWWNFAECDWKWVDTMAPWFVMCRRCRYKVKRPWRGIGQCRGASSSHLYAARCVLLHRNGHDRCRWVAGQDGDPSCANVVKTLSVWCPTPLSYSQQCSRCSRASAMCTAFTLFVRDRFNIWFSAGTGCYHRHEHFLHTMITASETINWFLKTSSKYLLVIIMSAIQHCSMLDLLAPEKLRPNSSFVVMHCRKVEQYSRREGQLWASCQ